MKLYKNVSINERREGYGTFSASHKAKFSARGGYSQLVQDPLATGEAPGGSPGEQALVRTATLRDPAADPSYPRVPDFSHCVQFSRCKKLRGGCWFAHDAATLVYGGNQDKELSLWNLRTGERRVGLSRSGGIISSALAPMHAACGSVVCIAAMDGLAMYTMPVSDGIEACKLVWEDVDAAYCDVAFSPAGNLVASAQCKSGLVQLRDAMTGQVRAAVDSFPACCKIGREQYTCALGFGHDLLVIGGRKGKSNERQLRAVSVTSLLQGSETEYEDASLPGVFSSIAFDGARTSLAVVTARPAKLMLWRLQHREQWTMRKQAGHTSLRDRVHRDANSVWNWDAPRIFEERQAVAYTQQAKSFDQRWFTSVAFSRDGTMICTGMRPGSTFALWDVESSQCFRVIPAPGSDGRVSAFSPAGDALAVGGESEPIVMCTLRSTHYAEMFEICSGDVEERLNSGAICSTTNFVVMVSKSRVVVKSRPDGKVMIDADLGDRISSGYFPVAISPLENQIACAHDGSEPQTVSLHDIPTGAVHKLYIHDDDWFCGVSYSPDGVSVLVFGSWGTKIFNSSTCEQTHVIRGPESTAMHSAAIDPSNQFVLTTGDSGCCAVFDLNSQSEVCRLDDCAQERRKTYGGCYDDTGRRLAYCMRDANHISEGDDENNTVVVVCDAKPPCRETNRFHFKGPPFKNLQFSPGGGKYLLFVTRCEGHISTMVLDSHTGIEMPWSSVLIALTVPHVVTTVSGIQWAMKQSESTDVSLFLQVVAANQVIMIDVERFVSAYDNGIFSVDQLSQLAVVSPNGISKLTARWPRLSNIYDIDTGDTVLHRCVRNSTQIQALSVSAWFSGGTQYTLMRNKHGRSALKEAALRKRARCCQALVANLDPQLPLPRSIFLTEDLVAIAKHMPELLVKCIECLEQKDRYNLFRPIRNLRLLKKTPKDFAVRASKNGKGIDPFDGYEIVSEVQSQDDTEKNLGAHETFVECKGSVSCRSQVQVMALRRFVWVPADDERAYQYDQPYTQLIMALAGTYDKQLDALLKTKLMRVTTQHKWDGYVHALVVWEFRFYVFHTLVLAVTTKMIVLYDSESQQEDILTMLLQCVLLATNSVCFYREVRQLMGSSGTWPERLHEHFSSGWNWLQLAGVCCVYATLCAHLLGNHFFDTVRRAAAAGVMFNMLSLLEVLKSVKREVGHLILTIEKIMFDIRPFAWVVCILLVGFSLAFTISAETTPRGDTENSSTSTPTKQDEPRVAWEEAFSGVLDTLMTLPLALFGDFDALVYHNVESQVFFFVFLVLMPVVMINMLIAIMNDSYSTITQHEGDNQRRRLQAMTIIDAEARMSHATLQNTNWFPEYLEVLEPIIHATHNDINSNPVVHTDGEERIAMSAQLIALKAQIDKMSSQLEPALSQIEEIRQNLDITPTPVRDHSRTEL